ncbi:MAG: SDR family oxidoreductase [Azospirillum sp.]|nr:SDR family oxidoreductase [Azospirillum sp.]MCA3266396.1 SDR family oxidoreductase [Azospirillum sp.]
MNPAGGGRAAYPSLAGRRVLITGGATGIGAALVRAFAAQNAHVGFVDLQAAPAAALVAEIAATGGSAAFERCDLRDIAALRAAIAALRARLGPFTVLVNNAANDERHEFLDVTPEFFDDRVAVNLRHAYFAAQAVVPDMRAAGGGTIVNFGSVSWLMGSADLSVYATLKSAAYGLTRVLAREFGSDNIRANCILPGWIMTERQIEKWLTPAGESAIRERQCIKRALVPEDIAKAVLFLASEESSGMTCQQIVVDGGWV